MKLHEIYKASGFPEALRILKEIGAEFCPILDTQVSGNPIIQDKKLIRTVTHILLNDLTGVYGIFIENTLDVAG